ncbi:MAG: RDD family protein [Flavobacteriaceae bacterium]|jgi:uncharacterized RDD family membrane protein YckC|nr:RDD family protein [Flavobacteriaceae bacterium]
MNSFRDPVDHSLASKGLRFANFIIDYIFLLVLMFMFGVVLAILNMTSLLEVFDKPFIGNIVGIFIYFVFMLVQEAAFKGRSLGKLITGTQVVMEDGSEPTMNEYFVRSISRCVPFEAFSFFGTTGWHDSWSNTRVVIKKEFEENQLKFNSIEQIGSNS